MIPLINDLPEQAVLGCLMKAPVGCAREIWDSLQTEDFADSRHRAVFDAIGTCLIAGVMPDPVVVLNDMRTQGHALMTVNEVSVFLIDLMQMSPTIGSGSYYARAVRADSFRRRVQQCGLRLQQASETDSLESLRGLISDELAAVCEALTRIEQMAA